MTLIAWLGPTVAVCGVPDERHGSLAACCFICLPTEEGVGAEPGVTVIVTVLLLSWNVTLVPEPDRAHPSGYLIE